MRLTLLTILVLALLCPAWGQTCTNVTIRATYSFVCTGFLTPAPGAPQATFAAQGVVTGDYSGVFQGSGKASLGGNIVDQVVKGTANVNSDCTGTITYTSTINGQKAPDLNIMFHVIDQGKEIRGFVTDPGSTATCTLKLMSR